MAAVARVDAGVSGGGVGASASGVVVEAGGGAGRGEVLARIMPPVTKWGDGGYIRGPALPGGGVGDGGGSAGGGGSGQGGGRRSRRRRKGLGGALILGDGAGQTAAAEGGGGDRERNAAVYATCWPVPGVGGLSDSKARGMTVATVDHADRAHQVRDHGSNLLVCALDVPLSLSKARRYPAHQMTSRGVSFDSAFDELHARQARLGEMGIADLGGVGARGKTGSVSGMTVAMAAEEAARRGRSLRELTRQRLNEPGMGDSEEAAEAYARRQIAAYQAGTWKAVEA